VLHSRRVLGVSLVQYARFVHYIVLPFATFSFALSFPSYKFAYFLIMVLNYIQAYRANDRMVDDKQDRRDCDLFLLFLSVFFAMFAGNSYKIVQ
jgi:hypothetical protein